MLTLGSLFDGVGTWQLAARITGIQPLWSSEIDTFCRAVTRRHFPDTIQLGDINGIDYPPHVDIITASSPCQDLSVAGKRSGLHGKRSRLFFRAIELIRRVRPQFFIWENVTGALTSNGGADFHAVIESILQEPVPVPRRWSNAGLVDGRLCQIAYRILDAQFFGVPQRRRRIFLVADFAGRRAAKILFELTGLSGDIATGTSSQRHAAASNSSDSDTAIFDMSHANEALRPVTGGKVNCLTSRMGTGGNQIPVVFGIDRAAFNQGINAQFKPQITPEMSATLTARGASAVAVNNVIRKLTPVECERLMGLPDDWTQGGSDSARYRALGNSLVLPCATFILHRVAQC